MIERNVLLFLIDDHQSERSKVLMLNGSEIEFWDWFWNLINGRKGG